MKNLLNKAIRIATRAHLGQKYDDGRNFIVHPTQTAKLLAMVAPLDDNLICAGILHDTIEDTFLTYESLKKLFNKDIADLVKEVTKKPGTFGRPATFPNLKTQRGIMLKFADRLSNLSNMKGWDNKKKQWYLKSSKFWK